MGTLMTQHNRLITYPVYQYKLLHGTCAFMMILGLYAKVHWCIIYALFLHVLTALVFL